MTTFETFSVEIGVVGAVSPGYYATRPSIPEDPAASAEQFAQWTASVQAFLEIAPAETLAYATREAVEAHANRPGPPWVIWHPGIEPHGAVFGAANDLAGFLRGPALEAAPKVEVLSYLRSCCEWDRKWLRRMAGVPDEEALCEANETTEAIARTLEGVRPDRLYAIVVKRIF